MTVDSLDFRVHSPKSEVQTPKLKKEIGDWRLDFGLFVSYFLFLTLNSQLLTPHFSFATEVTIGRPAMEVSTSPWRDLEKFFLPTTGWEASISTGRAMVWDGQNWWVKIATDDPAAPIEGNEYSYRYVVKEDANFVLEQTTGDRKVSVPLFASTDTERVVKVFDNFGRPSTPQPPPSISGLRNRSPCQNLFTRISWTEPKFATQIGTTPAGALTSANIQNLSIRDLLVYQIWRSTENVDANLSSASYQQVGSVLNTESEFIDSNVLAGVTYYYVVRTRDAYEPPDFSSFTAPISPTPAVQVEITLELNVSALSGNSNGVFVTVKIPGEAKAILEKAPLTSNGDGTWSITFLKDAVIAGKKLQWRYFRNTKNGEEIEPNLPTDSKEHEFMLDANNPQMDISGCPYKLKFHDRWGIPTFDETPKGLPKLFASVVISSGVTEPGIGSGDAIYVGMDQKTETVLHGHGEEKLSCPGALVWYSAAGGTYTPIPHPSLPNVKVYFATSTETASKLWDVAISTLPGYSVVVSTVSGVPVPVAPSRAFGEPVARLFVKTDNSFYKFQPVDVDGKVTGNSSLALQPGDEVPKWVDISSNVKFSNTLQIKSGQRTGELVMSWIAPPWVSTPNVGPAHRYDVRYATFPIQDLASLKASKMLGRLAASWIGSAEHFATISMGETSPGYHFAVIPIYGDWSQEAKVVIQFGRLGVAPKLLQVNAKPKEVAQRKVVKGTLGPTALGRNNIAADSSEAELHANLEVPKSGLDWPQVMARILNARETGDDSALLSSIEKANEEAQKTSRRITGVLALLNKAGETAADSSVVSYEISDLAGNSYFDKDERVAKLPLKISLPIPSSWRDENYNGILDSTENTEKPVRLADLRVYRLNSKGNFWELVNEGAQEVDLAKRVVKAEVKKLSTFALFAPGGAARDLANLVVYPNPFVPFDENCENGFPFGESCGGFGSEKSGIVFDNLTANSEIFIYTLSMDLVRRHKLTGSGIEEQTGKWRWDAKNDLGETLASGVYIYIVKDDGAQGLTKKTGRVVIVR